MDAALSRREREVADLVAEGLTNREIAERLVISERTAEGHVEQIRNKLGFRSRTQIAGWVERQRTGTAIAPSGEGLAAIAVDAPRPARVQLPRVPRGAVAVGLAAVVVALTAAAFWPRPQTATLELVAGIGTRGYSGDGGPAVAAQIDEPTSMAFARDGALVFADSDSGMNGKTHIRRVDSAGVIRTIAGNLSPPQLFNVAEVGQHLSMPRETRIAVGPDLEIYVAGGTADRTMNWVGRIDGDGGRFSWLAGGGPCCAARRTSLLTPRGLAFGPDGVLYVSNTGTSQILAVPIDGSVTTIAGTGTRGDAGDGGPAASATFYAPPSIRFSPDGSLLVVDAYNHRVRLIDHGGTITTVAGTGERGFAGDNGPAILARLTLPTDIAFGPDGRMYIADSGNARLRVVGRDGRITTVAGPEGLVRPNALAFDAQGVLYVADAGAHRIFKLVPAR